MVSEIIMADSVELKSLNETNNSETPVMGKQSTLQPKNLPRDRILDEQESNRSKRAKIQSWMIKNLSDQSVEGGGGADGGPAVLDGVAGDVLEVDDGALVEGVGLDDVVVVGGDHGLL